jgi:hypothetical protein
MDICEFHYIISLDNIASILRHGILSHAEIERRGIARTDISMLEVQNKRGGIQVPKALKLHEYVNLYFDARNPMMYKRKEDNVCILRISPDVLKIDGVVITDQNAASAYVRFFDTSSISELKLAFIFARDWRHPDNEILGHQHRSAKCAEILVPYVIPQEYIIGIYVKNQAQIISLEQQGFESGKATINPDMFFGVT